MKLTDEKTNHIMVDIETWGLSADSVICSIGAVCFNIKDGLKDEFYVENLSIKEQMALFNRTVHPDTIKWWIKQDKEAQKCFEKDNGYGEGLIQFHSWINQRISNVEFYDPQDNGYKMKNPYYMWSKSSFDFNVLDHALRTYPIGIPWNYKRVMDLRTIYELINSDVKYEGVKHNALDDAKNQALQAIDILRRFQQTCDLSTTFVASHGCFSGDNCPTPEYKITISK
jgi:hypothetical protein